MKPKIIGAVILAVTAAVAGMILLFTDKSQITALGGYLGSEKIGLFEDEEIAEYIKKTYHLTFDYSRAGSLDMVTADLSGRNYLFPSSQTALEYYNEVHGSAKADEIVFNTPIVLYSHKIVAALLANALNGGKTVDERTISAVLPKLKEIFSRTGYMETSSSDLFNQFLRMGVGAKPIIAGYESQILEYAAENPTAYEKKRTMLW